MASSVPSPALSTASGSGSLMDKKRKRDFGVVRKTAVELSRESEYRPTETLTQMQLGVDWLKQQGVPKTFEQIVSYLSLQRADEDKVKKLETAMKAGRHPKINYNPQTKVFTYKPIIPVRDRESLRQYLQGIKSGLGVKVEDIKDGWPDCVPDLESMAGRGEILLVRGGSSKAKGGAGGAGGAAGGGAKDQPKMVWYSDPTLHTMLPDELRKMWLGVKLPNSEDLMREKLIAAGIAPTTQPSVEKKGPAPAKAKRKVRRSNKGTSTNVNVPLKDYSHLRK